MAQMVKGKALERLRQVLDKVPELKGLSSVSPEFEKWRRNAEVAIANIFERESSHVADFNEIPYTPSVWTSAMPDSEFQAAYEGGLESARAILESMIDEISEYWEDENGATRSSDSHRKRTDKHERSLCRPWERRRRS